jgi:hypothetical protein
VIERAPSGIACARPHLVPVNAHDADQRTLDQASIARREEG